MLKEFKEFAFKGNVLDLAIGVIIAGAFGLIVKSLVGDIIMPIVGAIFGGLDFTNMFAPLASGVTATTLDAAREQGAVLAAPGIVAASGGVSHFTAWSVSLPAAMVGSWGHGRRCRARARMS